MTGWRSALPAALPRSLALIGLLLLTSCAPGRSGSRVPRTAAELSAAAQSALAAGKAQEALAGFDEALARDPRWLPALRGRIESARRLGLLAGILREAESRIQADRSDGLSYYTFGLCRFAQGDQFAAVAALRRAAELLPREADVWFRLGLALFDGESFAEARGPLGRAVELAPGVARYRAPLAACLDRLGDHAAAIAQLAAVPGLEPTEDEAALAVQTARMLTDPFRGLPVELRADLEQALAYLARDAPGLAVPLLEGLVARAPELGAAHALLGLAAQRLDETGRAVGELQRAAELSPFSPQPHLYLSELYGARDRREQATKELLLALERNPLDPAALRKLGLLRMESPGGAEGALQPLRAAIALRPGDRSTALLLARTELAVPAEASRGRARLERLLAASPDDAELLLRLAQALAEQRAQAPAEERQQLEAKAGDLADRVLRLQPGNAAASRLLTLLRGER